MDGSRRVWVVWLLLAAFAALFALMEKAGGSENVRVLLQFGADQRDLALHGQPWRWVSSGLLHIGIAHLLLNAWALYALGPGLERLYGARAFWALFVASVLGGSATSALVVPGVSAGASGGLFGLFAAYVVFYLKRRAVLPPLVRAAMERWIGSAVLANVMMALAVPAINHAAHFGGFVAGAAMSAVLKPWDREGVVQKAATWAVTLVAFLAIGVSAVDAARVAQQPWDYPSREWRDPEGRYSVRVPAYLAPEVQEGELQAFVGIGVALGVHSEPREASGWEEKEKAEYPPERYRDTRFWEEDGGRWLAARMVISGGDDLEVWSTWEKGRVYRLMLRAGGDFSEHRPQFLKFVRSFRVLSAP